MPKFNIKTIVSHLSDHPLLEPNKYEVIISGPIKISKNILFNCHRCEVPGHNIASFDHSTIGVKRKIPNEELYDDLSTTFYNSHHIEELIAINKWLKLIGGGKNYRLAYYNDIISDMQINIYDLQENLTSSIKIFEAYPVGVSEIELSYAQELPSEITVNWSYHSFEIESKVKH